MAGRSLRDRAAKSKEESAELEETRRALARTIELLAASEQWASMGRLVGGIAHELNTPIASVRAAADGLVDLVAEYESSIRDSTVTAEDHAQIAADMRAALVAISGAATKLARLVRSMRTHAHEPSARSGQLFGVVDLAQQIAELLEHEARDAGCVLEVSSGSPEISMLGSPTYFSRMLEALVRNAIEAARGAHDRRVRVQIEEGTDEVVVRVIDRGSGIAGEDLDRVFLPMFTTKAGASGMGLTNARDIVERQFHGKLEIESEAYVGTCVTAVLRRRA